MIFIGTYATAPIVQFLPQEIYLPIISAIKAASPVVTMAANFGKVKECLMELKEGIKSSLKLNLMKVFWLKTSQNCDPC
jgi:hypothetical protein